MNGREIIKDIMNKEGKKNAEVAYSLGTVKQLYGTD